MLIDVSTLLFVFYISDLDDNIVNIASSFAIDTNIGGILDRGRISKFSSRSVGKVDQVQFNFDKCEVVPFGMSSVGGTYMGNGRALQNIVEQRDPGV